MAKRINKKKESKVIPILVGAGTVLSVLFIIALLYFGSYYRAKSDALRAANGNSVVKVIKEKRRLFFDGPGKDKLLVFYPGARVEYTAYSRLMLHLAEGGLDCVLVRMPLNFAIFDSGAFDEVRVDYGYYDQFYIGGHSMGGAMAALYASKNPDKLDGLVMLAAYPTKSLDGDLKVVSIYGSNDKVLNREKLAEGAQYLPASAKTFEIAGGNHAQFGDYGEQGGDGAADISSERQQSLTVQHILNSL